MTGCVIGIDPGINGALAILWDDDRAEVHDLPVAGGAGGKDELNAHALLDLLREDGCRAIWIERVGAMPKQGVSSTFRFGVAVGTIIGCAAATGYPVRFVTPQGWKAAAGLRGADKEPSRLMATQRFPAVAASLARKRDHGRAEALLIALYGRGRS